MGFIFGGNTGETQESIKRKREYAQALMAAKGAPRDVGEGLNSLGNAIAYRMALSQIGKGEAAMAEKNASLMAPIVESFGGGAQQFPAPPKADAAQYTPDDSMAGKIAETAQALGIDPVDLGTAISYETAGTFDPTKRGPTTQWGQHRGLIQFGEPQAKKYGVDWNNPVGSQLGADGAVAKYLRDTGVKPGMGMMDIYSAINAGSVGKYSASDANNGGAPGTVADKVNSQMAGHRAKAEAMMKAIQSGGPQVALLDPSIGVIPQQQERPASNAIRKMLSGQEQPVQVAQAAPQGQVSEQQVVQELFGSPAPRPQLNPGMLMQALSDPNISEQNRATLQGLLQQEMQKQDPAYQLQQQQAQLGLQKDQLQLDQMRDPSKVPMTPQQQVELQKAQFELERLKSGTPVDPLDAQYKQMQIKKLEADIAKAGQPDTPASFMSLDMQAKAAGYKEGTQEYQEFMRNGGGSGAPAAFISLDMQAKAAGLQPGTDEYKQFMGSRGAGLIAEAKAKGEAAGTFDSLDSKMAGLEKVVTDLDVLADKATYTMGGQAYDYARSQLGLDPRDAAIARAEYVAMVDNQVLPLLRDTFGAAFTQKEGDTLRNTLGDANKSPAEKKAILRAFIEQKRRDLQSLGTQTGKTPSKRLKYNPATGGLE